MASSAELMELTFQEITTQNDLFCQFDEKNGVLLLDIKNPLNDDDFATISEIIDPYFAANGELGGIIINSKKFPYWDGARNRRQYVDFAGNNHRKFKKAALCMGGFFVKFLVKIARGRVHPEVQMFKFKKIEAAQSWILFG